MLEMANTEYSEIAFLLYVIPPARHRQVGIGHLPSPRF